MEDVRPLIFLNRILHDVLGFAQTVQVILTILFYKVNIFSLFDKLSPKIIPYFTNRVKIWEIN